MSMNDRIIVDSCFDMNDDLMKSDIFETVPLTIIIDDDEIIDKELNIHNLIKKMKNSKNAIKTACPSPHDFLHAFSRNKSSFVITLSKELSGSFNSAMMAAKQLKETYPEKFVHVFNSKSAAAAQSLIGMKIKHLMEQKHSDNEIVEKTNNYISKMKTYFILESLDNLVKAGRMSKVKAHIASILHISPIMGDDGNGEIRLVEMVRGKKKSFKRLVEIIGEQEIDFENRILGISQCNALEKAEDLKKAILEKYPFKDVVIFNARGITAIYANDGGIVISF